MLKCYIMIKMRVIKKCKGNDMLSNLLKDNKELMKEYDFEKNIEIDLNSITEEMGISVWWKCSKCGYEWNIKISSRYIKGNGCQKCAGNKRLETRRKTEKN